MKTDDFDYKLPKELIAQAPLKNRDQSRLLVLDKNNGEIEHKKFCDIVDYLNKGDVLVMNNSKVFPARLIGKRKNTGGKVEVFLHKLIKGNKWQCLVGGRKIKIELEVEFSNELNCRIVKDNEDGTWDVVFDKNDKEMMEIVNEIGLVPLPPYIKRDSIESRDSSTSLRSAQNDKDAYQTVYADDDKVGSVAAPTAGLHFTPELLEKIKARGVQIEYITLHVGLGTFASVKVDDVAKHKMHTEFVEIKKDTIDKIKNAKKNNRKIIAVGTTSVRSLESFWQDPESYNLKAKSYSAWVNIFIYPGCEFKIVDAMITNFHLPKSTLVMLVSAMAGKDNIDKAYAEAIKEKYRFFSYGDAMFIQ